MATTCPNCAKEFSMSTALCHDWRDPNRSFGCPHCNTFFVKDMTPNLSQNMRIGVIAGGVMTPAAMLFTRGLFNGQPELMVASGSILLSMLFLEVYQSLPWNKPLERSDYSPNSVGEDQASVETSAG